jgi:hypothetical protein
LTQDASGYRIKRGRFHNSESPITSCAKFPGRGPSNSTRDVSLINSANNIADAIDCRAPIINYLCNLSVRIDKNVDDVLFKCLDPDDVILAMAEVHERICGTHQSAPKMKWLLRRSSFYWPHMIADCQVCGKFSDVQLVPTTELDPIIKPWAFRGGVWTL